MKIDSFTERVRIIVDIIPHGRDSTIIDIIYKLPVIINLAQTITINEKSNHFIIINPTIF